MHSFILLPLIALAALTVYKTISIIWTKLQNNAMARRLGCQPAPSLPDGGWFGIQNLRDLQTADKEQLFPDLMLARQVRMTELLGRECSTFSVEALGQKCWATSDPKNIQAMLATQFQDFDLGPVRRAVMGAVLGDGIFTLDGKKWEHSRAMLRPNFVREQISDIKMEERHVQNLISVLPIRANGWTDFTDIQTLFFRLTMDAATEFLFDESANSQITEAGKLSTDDRSFATNFDQAQLHMAKQFRFLDLYWLYRSEEYKKNGKIVNDFAQHYVDLALKQSSTAAEKPTEDGKQKYVFLAALAQQTRDPEELRAQLLNILLAGRDTTASLLSWTFAELLRHPEVFTKLRHAIIHDFGTYSNPKEMTFASLKACQYLQHTISETLRLWPVVPGNSRRTNKPTTLPRGGGPDGLSPVFIPANTQVDYSVHVTHRRKDLWGEDAGEFRPERFVSRRPGWEYLPFNGGPRICIGQQFALTEASYVVVRLLQKFDSIEAAEGQFELPIRSNLSLTSCPAKLVTLRLREARD